MGAIDRTTAFLRSVVVGGEPPATGEDGEAEQQQLAIPTGDKHLALLLLLEFAVQKGQDIFLSPPLPGTILV